MFRKKILLTFASALLLASCGGGAATSKDNKPTYVDLTPETIYGKVSDFSAKNGELNVGDELKFKVTPAEDILIENVTVNSKEVEKGEDGFYSWKMEEGVNRIKANYVVDKTVDFVNKFKLKLDETTYWRLFNRSKVMDFRRDGIELMNLPQNDGGFINIVDGDTTHFETKNYGYTVKVRYLGIDTPESTSEIEKWGKSASNYSKDLFTNRAKYVILQSQGWARGDENKAATADGNQRSLAYVWYAETENPAIEDFKCVNLEMVYEGFSSGIGALEDMGEEYYKMFDKACKSAEANERRLFSNEIDPNYDYTVDNGGDPVDLTLKEIYDARDMQYEYKANGDPKTIIGDNNPLIDGKTLVRVKGYITRVIGYSFYIQDQPSYDRGVDGSLPEAYGLYVFTYSGHSLRIGDYVSVVGVLSIYSGTYQIQGVSWKNFSPDPRRQMTRISSGHEIKPIELTAQEFNAMKYDEVLVNVTDEISFQDKKAGGLSLSFGGTHEVDTYNEHYPFYCNTNKIVFFGKAGDEVVRFTQDQDIHLTYGTEIANSYKFFLGGTNYYYPEHPEYIGLKNANVSNTKNGKYIHEVYNQDGTSEIVTEDIDPNGLITTEYKAKKALTGGISQMYVSSSGSMTTHCYQVTIVFPGDVTITGEQA